MRETVALLVFSCIIFLFVACKKTGDNASSTLLSKSSEAETDYQDDLPYKLMWSDEFNYNGSADTSKWSYDVGNNGWGNNELQYYTKGRSENARVANGSLTIEARKEMFNGNKYYTSARLTTKNIAGWTYGKFEIRAKIPKGVGTWPTIWLLSANEPMNWPDDGELDIMEAVGFQSNVIHGTAHNQLYNGANGLFKSGSLYVADAQEAFHVYSMEWTDKTLTWLVDGIPYYNYTDPGLGSPGWPYNKNFYLIMNVAIGGNYGGKEGIDDSIFPQQMVVDYVRVYQKKN